MMNQAEGGDNATNDNHHNNIRYEPISIESHGLDSNVVPRLSQQSQSSMPSYHLYACFWTLGLLNNASYVIMLAAAKNISEGGTALVFLANILPALIIKGSAPYWFDKISYFRRLQLATLSMATSFALVASSSQKEQLIGQLLGVAIGSLQGGLGEASLLALAGKSDAMDQSKEGDSNAQQQKQTEEEKGSGRCLTCFASGTGFAGVFGFFWKWFWKDWLQFSLSTTLWLAMVLAFSYWSTFRYVMRYQQHQQQHEHGVIQQPQDMHSYHDQVEPVVDEKVDTEETASAQALSLEEFDDEENNGDFDGSTLPSALPKDLVIEISAMTGWERFQLVLSLWPYAIPLFTVYVAEYALQSGTWTAIGFPVSDMKSRDAFYEYSNWMYQAGVFLSRSSGTLFSAPMAVLWLMPMLQVCNVGFYWFVAARQQDHEDETTGIYSAAFLYAAALYTGLLGGAVYCHGYIRICKDLPLQHREFALSATSVAECLGIVVADLFGLVIQSCLYQINGLQGAVLTCPLPSK